ncbi:unnamed protein product [Rhizophagus irregularis]|nr:unnamed protein product [Rhizophagus irregularis]
MSMWFRQQRTIAYNVCPWALAPYFIYSIVPSVIRFLIGYLVFDEGYVERSGLESWTLYVLIIEQKISENIDETVVETLTKYIIIFSGNKARLFEYIIEA